MTRVLVVDDNEQVRQIVSHGLSREGFDTQTVGTVDEAWNAMLAEPPDAAVVDLRLPGDGWTLLARIRGDYRFYQLPVVVLTAMIDPEVMDQAHALGCEYLGKPFALAALISRLPSARDRAAQVEEPPEAVTSRPVRVLLLMGDYRIEGTMEFPPDVADFSEAWESVLESRHSSLAVHDATVATIDGTGVLSSAPVVHVRKTDVRAASPLDEQIAAETG